MKKVVQNVQLKEDVNQNKEIKITRENSTLTYDDTKHIYKVYMNKLPRRISSRESLIGSSWHL